jgi:ribokinase
MGLAFCSYFYRAYWRSKIVSLIVCGAINWDISCFTERLPVPGEKVIIKHITRVSGGTGGNVAVAAARILGAKKVAMIGALGKDDIARQQIAIFEDEGVITEGVHQIAGVESGQAYILIDQKGENVIANHLGANARLGLEHLNKAQVKQQLEECRGIVLTDPSLEVAGEIVKLAKRRGVSLLWDPGILVYRDREKMQALTREAEVLFLNETETSALLGTEELNLSLQRLKELGFHNNVVLKLGAQGAVMLELVSDTVIEVPALPIKKLGLNVVNTVGCGDVFAGVFAAYHVLGANLQESLVMASAAAAINATRPETRGSPDRATLEKVANRSQKLGFAIRERKLL